MVIAGGAANMAVMYTATAAARDRHLQVYVPLDGVYSPDAYRYEYALYQSVSAAVSAKKELGLPCTGGWKCDR